MVDNYVVVPPEIMLANKEVTLTRDIFFVNKIPFLLTLSCHLQFMTAEHMMSRMIARVVQGMQNIVDLYEK